MNIVAFIVERFAELSTIIFSMFFLYRVLDTKISIKKQIIVGTVFICASMFYFYMNLGYNPYFSLFTGLIYAQIVFAGKFRTNLFWNMIAIVMDGVVDASVISVFLLLPDASIAQAGLPGIERTVIILVSKSILLLLYYIITLRVDKSDLIQGLDSIFLFLIPVGCWTMLELQFKYGNELASDISQPLFAVGSITLFVIITSVVITYNRITSYFKEAARSKIHLRIAETTQEHIGQINDLYMQLSAVRHDLHNHFSAISGYIKAKEYERLEEYVGNLTDITASAAEHVPHPVLNSLIGAKITMAQAAGIQFTTDIVLPEKLPIHDVDLCILFSNILDNAFEANQNAFEPRFIHLNTRIVNSYWVIACRNATRKKGRFRSSGSLKSTKPAIGVHGIGTREIKAIAESTGGFVTYRYENQEFCTLVTLKLKNVCSG